jgi:hypothetical protein
LSKYCIHKNKLRKKGYNHIILVVFLTILLMAPFSELTFQKIQASKNDFFSDNIKILKTYIDEKTSKSDMLSVVNGERIEPDGSESPIRKYFTTQKIVWTFDDYWINTNYYPPHKGFGGLSEQIHSYGGIIGINCIFIPSWIGAMFGNEIRNYSVAREFSQYTSRFSQANIDKSLEFFNRSYIEVQCHGWNHSEYLNHATLSFAYTIVNYTLWNWYNNYHIKPRFWLGPSSAGNYNISLALQKFSETYWTVYAEDFKVYDSKLFPNNIEPAVEYIGPFIDPTFGCEWGNPYTTVQEAQQLFTVYSQGKEILAVRGHPDFLNGTNQRATENLTKWQQWIDWIYQTHTLININHTEAIEYKIDRENFIVEKNSPEQYTIDLTGCMFDHNVLFTNPDGTNQRNWILSDQNGHYIGTVREDVFFRLKNGIKYVLNADDVTPPTPNPSTWTTVPYATGRTSISMTATTATDPSGGEQYYFDETSGNAGGTDSGWQSSSSYTNSGLTCGSLYTYRVQTKDALGNNGSWSTLQSATTDACPIEELDQQQIQSFYNRWLFTTRWGGQSFIPTKTVLTRVELYIRKVGSPTTDVVLSVRSSLTGADLISVSKPASQIPTRKGWVEFNFSNLTVTSGVTYYLVLKTTGGNKINCYIWGCGSNTLYTNGMRWCGFLDGIIWMQNPKYDFCFKTYGFT